MSNLKLIRWILINALISILLSGVTSAPTPPPNPETPPLALSSHIEAPDDVSFTPLDRARLRAAAPAEEIEGATGLSAVAIVGDVGAYTEDYKSDMDTAVQALHNHGVTVHKFYHGEGAFTWADIVVAAEGAEFIIYMGHGVYSGAMPTPTWVGGFWLRSNHYISPDQIRTDLDGWLAEDSAVILSHVCFAAGSAAGESELSLPEAQRRIQLYAEPFVDLGMRTYFANNYFRSAANLINQLLADQEDRQTNGAIFKATYPFRESEFHATDYPQTGYDLWLSRDVAGWNHAFVGVPEHIFQKNRSSELGGLPASLAFTYSTAAASPMPAQHVLTPENVNSIASLAWEATTNVNWLHVTPSSGVTPESLSVQPQNLAEMADGVYEGALTITVTDPPDTQNSPQTIPVTLDVRTPALGGLPAAITFTYSITDQVWIPTRHTLHPRNTTTDDPITWQAESDGPFSLSHAEGATPQSFSVAPPDFGSLTITLLGPLADGVITVTATSPAQTLHAIQTIDVAFVGRAVAQHQTFLPLIIK